MIGGVEFSDQTIITRLIYKSAFLNFPALGIYYSSLHFGVNNIQHSIDIIRHS